MGLRRATGRQFAGFTLAHGIQGFGLAMRQRQCSIAGIGFGPRAPLRHDGHATFSVNLRSNAFQRFGAGGLAFAHRRRFGLEPRLGSQTGFVRGGDSRLRGLHRLRFYLDALLRFLRGLGIECAALIGQFGGLLFHRDTHARNRDSAFFGFNALVSLNDFAGLGIGVRLSAFRPLQIHGDAGLQCAECCGLRHGCTDRRR